MPNTKRKLTQDQRGFSVVKLLLTGVIAMIGIAFFWMLVVNHGKFSSSPQSKGSGHTVVNTSGFKLNL